MFRQTPELAVTQLKELTNEYYDYLIEEAVLFFGGLDNYQTDVYRLVHEASSSMTNLRTFEKDDLSLTFPRQRRHLQALFDKNVETLVTYLKENPKNESTTILNQKIGAMRRLNARLDSKRTDKSKLSDYRDQLVLENQILRQHRNKNWDNFFTAIYVIFLPPFALMHSLFNRVEYGTWNPNKTRGDEVVTKAEKILAEAKKPSHR